MKTESLDIDKAGVIGDIQIQSINNGQGFWMSIYKSTMIASLEATYKDEIIRTHGICNFVVVPSEDKTPKVLIEWYKRPRPLSDEELNNRHRGDMLTRLIKACKQLIDAPHQEHFAARLNDEEMAGLDSIKEVLAELDEG